MTIKTISKTYWADGTTGMTITSKRITRLIRSEIFAIGIFEIFKKIRKKNPYFNLWRIYGAKNVQTK